MLMGGLISTTPLLVSNWIHRSKNIFCRHSTSTCYTTLSLLFKSHTQIQTLPLSREYCVADAYCTLALPCLFQQTFRILQTAFFWAALYIANCLQKCVHNVLPTMGFLCVCCSMSCRWRGNGISATICAFLQGPPCQLFWTHAAISKALTLA